MENKNVICETLKNNNIKKFYEFSAKETDKEPKITMIDVMCFSMGGDYICPYYGLFDEESQKHCGNCWSPNM